MRILCGTLARWLEAVSSTLAEMVTRARKLTGRQEVLPCCGEDVVDIEHCRLGGQTTQSINHRVCRSSDDGCFPENEGYDAMTIRKDPHERVSYSARQTENPTDAIPPHNHALHTNRHILDLRCTRRAVLLNIDLYRLAMCQHFHTTPPQ